MYDTMNSSPLPFQRKFVQKLEFSNPKITLKSSRREFNIETEDRHEEHKQSNNEQYSISLSCNENLLHSPKFNGMQKT